MKNITFIIFLFLSNLLISQNLVQNPSFEKYKSNFKVKKWKIIPDYGLHKSGIIYFNEANPRIFHSVPYHIIGFQYPNSGKGYIGLSFYSRGYYQTKLKEPLIKDSLYYVSFYTNLSDTSEYAISNFGVFFRNNKVKGKDHISWNKYEPAVVCSDIICDTANWTKVSGIYKAKGGERYLVLGKVNTDKYMENGFIKRGLKVNNNCYKHLLFMSFYYFDDFSVIKINKSDVSKYKTGIYPLNKYDKSKVKKIPFGSHGYIIKPSKKG